MTDQSRSSAPLLLLASLLLGGCSDSGESRDAITRTDSAGIEIVWNDLDLLETQCEVAATPRVIIGSLVSSFVV